MKIILTEEELSGLILKTYSPPPEYRVTEVSVSKYSSGFCTIQLEREEIAPELPLEHSTEEAALRG